jgi:hypothetical protein
MSDRAHAIAGSFELAIAVSRFAAPRSHLKRLYVTEDEVHALAFPSVRKPRIVFLGAGYRSSNTDRLVEEVRCAVLGQYAWHGFAILDRLCASLLSVRTL